VDLLLLSYFGGLSMSFFMGLLPNGLLRRNLKILRQSVKTNFDVYLKGKRRNFFGRMAKIFKLQSKCHSATGPLNKKDPKLGPFLK
jgi:hypothetical protein